MNKYKSFGLELQAARAAAGLTQRELAELFKCHYTSVEKWELGKAVPSAYHYFLYMKLLNFRVIPPEPKVKRGVFNDRM